MKTVRFMGVELSVEPCKKCHRLPCFVVVEDSILLQCSGARPCNGVYVGEMSKKTVDIGMLRSAVFNWNNMQKEKTNETN